MPRCARSDVSQGLNLRASSTWYGRGGSAPSSSRKVGSQEGRKLKRGGGRQRWLNGGRGGVELGVGVGSGSGRSRSTNSSKEHLIPAACSYGDGAGRWPRGWLCACW